MKKTSKRTRSSIPIGRYNVDGTISWIDCDIQPNSVVQPRKGNCSCKNYTGHTERIGGTQMSDRQTNAERYEAAREAIQRLFKDMSVSQAAARINLKSLIDEIEILIDSLDSEEEERK
jgi:hypothetical protein